MSHDFKVGMKVRAKRDLSDGPDDYSPGGTYASKGELLVIREVRDTGPYPISVSHEHITDRTFGVSPDEIFESLLDTEVASND